MNPNIARSRYTPTVGSFTKSQQLPQRNIPRYNDLNLMMEYPHVTSVNTKNISRHLEQPSLWLSHEVPYGTIERIPDYDDVAEPLAEPFSFDLRGPDNVPRITLNPAESKIIANELFYDTSSGSNKSVPINVNSEIQLNIGSTSNINRSRKIPQIETYNGPSYMDTAHDVYMEALRARAIAVTRYMQSNKHYSNWSENWKLLEKNLMKTKLLFQSLDTSDADIAYVINKGEEIRFRIHDEKRFVPINVYQYVLYHEMAHLSTTELQHTPKFHELLNIISLAGHECGFIDLKRISHTMYTTNGQAILCRGSLKEEIVEGCGWLSSANPGNKDYYDAVIELIENS